MIKFSVNFRINMRYILICALLLCNLYHCNISLAADNAEILRRKYVSLMPQLNSNQFRHALYLDSTESSSAITGDIYALINHSFDSINSTLNDSAKGPANWCDVMILHPNTKYCHASTGTDGKKLSVIVGKKMQQSLSNAYRMGFNYQVVATNSEYFRIYINADSGPLGTKDYCIVLEAVAIDAKHSFLHFTYSFGYGTLFRVMIKTYLATIGRNKVGFTSNGLQSNGQPDYVGGIRGMVERNTMRYYLALDTYLNALSLPADKRLEKCLSSWFSATEQYARQLHELEQQEYIQMKYQEYQRQQIAQ
ncbi:MAG: hypothetical protein NT178_08810 [Proteobacteria bacterium]|nr:hypothetical protein [Pseudomonadota bacterium]